MSELANNPEYALRDVAGEDLAFLIDSFLCDAPLQLQAMASAAAQGDLALLGRAARSLRSSSERLAVTEVARMSKKLGTAVGYRCSPQDVRALLARLETAFLDAVPVLLERLAQRHPGAARIQGIPYGIQPHSAVKLSVDEGQRREGRESR